MATGRCWTASVRPLDSSHWPTLRARLDKAGIGWEQVRVADEPSPQLVDEAVRQFHGASIAAVVGIGGGSVDAAKAIAGLLPGGDSVSGLSGRDRPKTYHGPANAVHRVAPPLPAPVAKPPRTPC